MAINNQLLALSAQGAQPRMADAMARGYAQGNAMLQAQQQQETRNNLSQIAQAYSQGGPDAAKQLAGQLGQYEQTREIDNTQYSRGRNQVEDQRDQRNFSRLENRDQVGDEQFNRQFKATKDYRQQDLNLRSRPNYSFVTGADGNSYAVDPRNPQGGYMPIQGQPSDPFFDKLNSQPTQPTEQGGVVGNQPRNMGNIPPEIRATAQQLAGIGDKAGAKQVVKDWLGGGRGDPKSETDMRKEVTKITSDYTDVEGAFARIRSSAGDESGAADMSLIFNYMKMLDPGSTVREGEFATARDTAGIPTRIVNLYNKALSGAFLSKDQRMEFFGQAQKLYGAAKGRYDYTVNQYKDIAERQGLNGQNIFMQTDPQYSTPLQTGGTEQSAGQSSQVDAETQSYINQYRSK